MGLITFLTLSFFAAEYECYKDGSIYGYEYDKNTGRCSCNPGWTGEKCEDCATAVKVSLENDALVSHGSYAGTYQMTNDVNGKPSYTLIGKAIWYYKDLLYKGKYHDLWFIGPVNDLGKF